MAALKRTLQVFIGSAAVAAGVVVAPMAAQASPMCDQAPPAGVRAYDCIESDLGRKTSMETLATSDGAFIYAKDHAHSGNRLLWPDLCSKVAIFDAADARIGETRERCYHLNARDDKEESWSEQLTPYQAANLGYIKIEHRRK